jgi:hypothetical protein
VRREGEVKQRLKQVQFRAFKKDVHECLKVCAENCTHNLRIQMSEDYKKGVCTKHRKICDSEIDRSVAKSCADFQPKISKEEIQQDFNLKVSRHDKSLPADLLTLLWVLGETPSVDDLVEAEKALLKKNSVESCLTMTGHLFRVLEPQRYSPKVLVYKQPVDPEMAPFLVSKEDSFFWVERASSEATVNTSVYSLQTRSLEDFYRDCLDVLFEYLVEKEWGNALRRKGKTAVKDLEGLISYLKSFGFEDLEILTEKPLSEKGLAHFTKLGVTLESTGVPWLKGWIVVVPKDRDYLGVSQLLVGEKGVVRGVSCVVHNAERALGVLKIDSSG